MRCGSSSAYARMGKCFAMYDREHNRLKLSHGELLEHLKDKDPAYYYTDILVSNGKTLGDFISRR